MKHIVSRFDKHAIAELPKVSFGGRIFVIISEEEANRAVDYLLKQPIIGLDTETKPSFSPGKRMNPVALLQVATLDTCFLFRLNRIGIPDCLKRLLGDTRIIKVGLSWHDDLLQLHRRAEFEAGTFAELQQMVKLIGIEDLSLQKIYANLFGQKISKSQRLTNWEADNLTPAQQSYAATDAWACVMMYNEIKRLHETQDYELELIPLPEPPAPKPKEEVETPKTDEPKKKGRRINYRRKKNVEGQPDKKENATPSKARTSRKSRSSKPHRSAT